MTDVRELMLEIAKKYKSSEEIRAGMDEIYGKGATAYIGEAIEAFYNK